MSEFNSARRTGVIKFGSDFNSVAEVTHLWGLTAKKLPYSISFRIPGAPDTIALLLSEQGGYGWQNVPHRGTNQDGRGWRQIERIDEVSADPEVSAKRCRDELARPLTRFVFWREKRDGVQWYKFHGTFRIDEAATRASLESGENICVYAKIADECPCPKAEWKTAEISESEFAGFVGHEAESVLLDEIDCRIGGEHGSLRSIKVWPGRKLFVKAVVAGGTQAVCTTSDENLLNEVGCPSADEVEFLIPRRDFECGYFRTLPGSLPHG